jgi:hypothetical protein
MTVSDLLGETTLDITISDRRRIRDWIEFLRQRLLLDSLEDTVPQGAEMDTILRSLARCEK